MSSTLSRYDENVVILKTPFLDLNFLNIDNNTFFGGVNFALSYVILYSPLLKMLLSNFHPLILLKLSGNTNSTFALPNEPDVPPEVAESKLFCGVFRTI